MINPTFSSNLILFLSGFSVVFLIVLWITLILWTFRDIRRRTRDTLIRILAVLVSTLLFIPGALVYLLLRPPLTLEEEYQKNLEEEALLQALEESNLCPGCSRKVNSDWSVCPGCHTKLKKKCASCGKLLDLNWDICPYCENPVAGYHRNDLDFDDVLPKNNKTPAENRLEME
jgi:hypothetical protein